MGLLLEQLESPIKQVTADDAYDGEPSYQTMTTHDALIAVVSPPQDKAVPSTGFEIDPSPRDSHLLMLASLGRLGWQEITGYGNTRVGRDRDGPLQVAHRRAAALSRRCCTAHRSRGRRAGSQSQAPMP